VAASTARQDPIPIPHLNPPGVVRRASWQDGPELRVSNWLTTWDFQEPIDAGLIGVPYSAASINPSGAGGGPEAVRLAFRYFVTASPDWETDVRDLRVRDLGDVGGHLTDVNIAHRNIEEAVAGALSLPDRPFIPMIVGGDHSITAPAVRGFAAANPGKKLGLINIDAHYDVRNLDSGPHNGTPFRQLLEGGQVGGRNFVELGVHGFMNAAYYGEWLKEQGATIISGRQVEKRGMDACILDALDRAGDGTDLIYVSVDIDCLSYVWTPGTSAASAEGLSPWQLMEAIYACGRDPNVAALDLVEIDPSRDVKDFTARTGCSVLLTFLAGFHHRKYGLPEVVAE
jgi:formiminoglutamase